MLQIHSNTSLKLTLSYNVTNLSMNAIENFVIPCKQIVRATYVPNNFKKDTRLTHSPS